MKLTLGLIFLATSLSLALPQDPRAISMSKDRGIEEDGKPGYRREDSAFSIVIYGAHDSEGDYRILGLDRPMKIKELTTFLNDFYRDFPKDAVTPDKRFNQPIPIPNILYAHGGWNETKNDGADLVTKLSKEHGVALYYFGIVEGFEISFKAPEGYPGYEAACIDYYQQRLKKAAEVLQKPEKPAADGKQ